MPSTTPTTAVDAGLSQPLGVAVDAAGNVYFADTGHQTIDEVDVATGKITVIAGGGTASPTTLPIAATSAGLSSPSGVAVASDGSLYIVDEAGLVEKISGGQLAVIAGGGSTPVASATNATQAMLNTPVGAAVDGSGNVYIADYGDKVVVKVSGASIAVVAGGGSAAPSTTAQAATSVQLASPAGVAVS